MADWWTHYLEGNVMRRPETPRSIILTMEDWHDGPSTAMWLFVRGNPVRPRMLMNEVAEALAENISDEEATRLKALEVWAIRECALANTAKSLREARKDFDQAVEAVGLHHCYADRIAGEL